MGKPIEVFCYQCDWTCADVIFGSGESHRDRRYSHDLVKCVAISLKVEWKLDDLCVFN